MNYAEFIETKTHLKGNYGFAPSFMPKDIFPFQESLIDWALRSGRASLFEDCGLGKTIQELTWSENVVRNTNGNVLLLNPLAVTQQTIHEGEKFGIECNRSNDGQVKGKITISNYERLHLFNPDDFVALCCDESGILKHFDGAYKNQITNFAKKMKYRLFATATPSPNDFIELGTHSEALGYMGYMDMLNMFFKNDQNNSKTGRHYGQALKWRFKGHSELPFWKWVCSWARAIRRPSDIGFDDNGFILPPLIEHEHIVRATHKAEGMLFDLPAIGLKEQREEQRRTIQERCEKVAELVADTGMPAISWCHLNTEGDLLEDMLSRSGFIQVSGNDSDDEKEEKLTAFSTGQARGLITKLKIGGWGLNYQHCSHQTYFPSHSFEQYYQGVRRCWRFGQKKPVTIDIITTEGGMGIMKNLQRKSVQADQMFSNLVREMNNAVSVSKKISYEKREVMPPWLA